MRSGGLEMMSSSAIVAFNLKEDSIGKNTIESSRIWLDDAEGLSFSQFHG
jgi:hypothetical protein